MIESDCTVPGYAIGDTVYIRGRVVAFCKTPWGPPDIQIAALAIDKQGNAIGDADRVYFVDPQQAVNAATVREEMRK